MNATHEIGTSTDLGINSHTGTLNEEITHQLGEYAGEHDIDAIESEYRDAIADVLPWGVRLCGETVYSDRAIEVSRDDLADLRESVCDGIDFWAIAEKHVR